MARREFLMLAQTYNGKMPIAGWFVSEKLDGIRAFWDGGISNGLPVAEVPYANKSGTKGSEVCTGLWTRHGNVIQAPMWWLGKLPEGITLDGELWTDRKDFQTVSSIVRTKRRTDESDARWEKVKYCIFDSPPLTIVGQSGEIKNPNFELIIDGEAVRKWLVSRNYAAKTAGKSAKQMFEFLEGMTRDLGYGVIHPVEQARLPDVESAAQAQLTDMLVDATQKKAEGLILRHPTSFWVPERCRTLLKVKELHDAEGTVLRVNPGFGRHEGRMGSLTLGLANGIMFDLGGGFTDAEREQQWLQGTIVTFKYRELSRDGVPKEARYWRKR